MAGVRCYWIKRQGRHAEAEEINPAGEDHPPAGADCSKTNDHLSRQARLAAAEKAGIGPISEKLQITDRPPPDLHFIARREAALRRA
jgi:hypothetical protein